MGSEGTEIQGFGKQRAVRVVVKEQKARLEEPQVEVIGLVALAEERKQAAEEAVSAGRVARPELARQERQGPQAHYSKTGSRRAVK